jgi:hypothetical protein
MALLLTTVSGGRFWRVSLPLPLPVGSMLQAPGMMLRRRRRR